MIAGTFNEKTYVAAGDQQVTAPLEHLGRRLARVDHPGSKKQHIDARDCRNLFNMLDTNYLLRWAACFGRNTIDAAIADGCQNLSSIGSDEGSVVQSGRSSEAETRSVG